MSDKAVYRTDPATPGLLIILREGSWVYMFTIKFMTKYYIHCNPCIVKCIIYNVQCPLWLRKWDSTLPSANTVIWCLLLLLFSVKGSLFSDQCTVFSVICLVCSVLCTIVVCSVLFAVCSVLFQLSICSVQCPAYSGQGAVIKMPITKPPLICWHYWIYLFMYIKHSKGS